jgi:lysophospholipase L1-like esterase
MKTKIKHGQKILFVGDSITDCGRRDVNRPLGNGYVNFFNDLVILNEPAKKVSIINKGISGNTILDLQQRWTDDVIINKPDWLSVKIGINDIHQYLQKTQRSVSPKEYLQIYDELLSVTCKKLPKCKIILIEPFYLSVENSKNSFRKDVLDILPQYLKIIRQMSRKYNTKLIKTQDLFLNILKHHQPDALAPEPVHPYSTGHLMIANWVYSELCK